MLANHQADRTQSHRLNKRTGRRLRLNNRNVCHALEVILKYKVIYRSGDNSSHLLSLSHPAPRRPRSHRLHYASGCNADTLAACIAWLCRRRRFAWTSRPRSTFIRAAASPGIGKSTLNAHTKERTAKPGHVKQTAGCRVPRVASFRLSQKMGREILP